MRAKPATALHAGAHDFLRLHHLLVLFALNTCLSPVTAAPAVWGLLGTGRGTNNIMMAIDALGLDIAGVGLIGSRDPAAASARATESRAIYDPLPQQDLRLVYGTASHVAL